MHGGDQNNAVLKATKDAIHHCCMAGISEIFDITDRKTQAFIKADIYAPHPEEVDPSVVTDYLEWWNVEAEVLVNRESQKPIVIGRGAQTIKYVRKCAERELSEMFGVKVSLQLWVRVEPNWMKNERLLVEMGYLGGEI
jgi:GTPase Era involved in 16S rRNA processing